MKYLNLRLVSTFVFCVLSFTAFSQKKWRVNGNNDSQLSGNTTNPSIGTNDDTPLIFETDGTERMRILANGDIRLGELTNNITGQAGYGTRLFFSGGPAFGPWNSDNSDPLWIARFNTSTDGSQLRINLGDNPGVACPSCVDMLNIGTLFGNQWISHMVVATNGFGSRVGVATENPLATLDVFDSLDRPQFRITQMEGSVFTDFQTTLDGYLLINPTIEIKL